MSAIVFDQLVLDGSYGRNGFAATSGLSVSTVKNYITVIPIGRRGDEINASMKFSPGDCGKIIEGLALASLEADYSQKDILEEALRAALVKVQQMGPPDLKDDIADLYLPPRRL